MTSNQISYFRSKEDARHNLAQEIETNRYNTAMLQETNRHNLAMEGVQSAGVNANYYASDISRANALTSAATQRSVAALTAGVNQEHYERMDSETQRHNDEVESENTRHNKRQESINNYDAETRRLQYQENKDEYDRYATYFWPMQHAKLSSEVDLNFVRAQTETVNAANNTIKAITGWIPFSGN